MDLISCQWCGIVLDKNRITCPEIWDTLTGELLPEMAIWNGEEHVPAVKCPVCHELIEY